MAKEPAKPSRTKVSLYNSGSGPRSFFSAERSQVVLRPGEEWNGEIFSADEEDLSADLTTPRDEIESREAAQLRALGQDQQGPGYAAGGEGNADEISLLAETLARDNTLDELRDIAKDEEVEVEGDANEQATAIAIARKRLGADAS